MNNKKRQLLLSLAGILGILAVVVGVTYAFFSYSKAGTQQNSISSGQINFVYMENPTGGRGIVMTDAMPMTDVQGKAQSGEDAYFDFKVVATSGKSISIPYTVTARVSSETTTLDPNVVKVWLSDQNNNELVPVKYFDAVDAASRNDVLHQFSGVAYASKYNERVLYTGTVPAKLEDTYIQNFRLRMWIDINTDFTPVDRQVEASCSVALDPNQELNAANCTGAGGEFTDAHTETVYPYNGKTFKVTVNVYANGEAVAENVTYSAAEVGYTNANASGVRTIKDALDDLSAKLQ